jgi:hypothetical protein
MASLPNTCFNMSNISKNIFPNLKQNFTQTCCSWKSPFRNHYIINWTSKICILFND